MHCKRTVKGFYLQQLHSIQQEMSQQDASVTVSAHGLCRNFGARLAVQDVSLELKRGEVLGFLGPNGAGKTTTMHMLTGNLAPSEGNIRICGIDLLDHPRAAKARLGYLPETPPLYQELTVDEYLRLAAKLRRISKVRAATDQAKERCGLTAVGRRLIGHLSKGYQQRAGIAQAIVHNPDVVILDEPTVGLDPNQMREIRALIRELGGAHSVILSTHILPEVETVCDRVQIMHNGRMVYSDSISGLAKYRRGQMILLGLHHPPAPDALKELDGVTEVETLSATQFRIHHAEGIDPTERLLKAAVEKGWGLYQITPHQTSLEDVFVQLTQGEDNA